MANLAQFNTRRRYLKAHRETINARRRDNYKRNAAFRLRASAAKKDHRSASNPEGLRIANNKLYLAIRLRTNELRSVPPEELLKVMGYR